MSPSTVEIELFCPHCQQLTFNHNRHDGKDSGQWDSISNNSYWPYLFKADQCDLPSLGFFEILSPRWRSLAFRYTRESRDKVHSFNFFDISKRLKLINTKIRMKREVWKRETITSLAKNNKRFLIKVHILDYIFLKTFTRYVFESDLFKVRPAVFKRLHTVKL